MQLKATEYAQGLFENGPANFVNLEISHAPNFKITVYYDKGIDNTALTRAAPVEIRKYLVFKPMNASRKTIEQERKSIADALTTANLRFGLAFDYETARYDLEIPEGTDQAKYAAIIPEALKARVDFHIGNPPEDIAAIYAGWWWDNSGGKCTTGWPVRNSSGQEAILTAGHCLPPSQMGFSWWSGAPTLTTVSSTDNRIVAGQSVDYAFFTLGTHTTTRVINVQNDLTNADGTRNYVPGFISAYYEITSPQLIVNGQYVCKQGMKTWLTCGTVVDTAFSGTGFSNLAKVSKSAQGNIAMSGDSGGPVFLWNSTKSMVHPLGLVKGANPTSSTVACKNTSATAANNTACYFTVMPLRIIRGYQPFTVNTVAGFVAP